MSVLTTNLSYDSSSKGGAFGFHLEYVGINLDTYTASFRVGRTSDDLYESDGLKLLDLRGVTRG